MDFKEIAGKLLDIKEIINTEEYKKGILLLEDIKIYQLTNFLAYKPNIDQNDKVLAGLIISILQSIYNNSSLMSPINDELYDTLYEKYSDYGQIVGALIDNPGDKIISKHIYPDLRGTLQKTYFILNKDRGKDVRRSIEMWFVRSEISNISDGGDVLFLAMPKYDGVSVIFECVNDLSVKALTRGDTIRNEATEIPFLVNTNFAFVNDRKSERYGVKTEIIMNNKDFIEFNKVYGEFKSPRSAVSSVINGKSFDPDMLKYLKIIPLQVQDYLSKDIYIPQYFLANTPIERISLNSNTCDNAKSAISNIKMELDEIGDPIDGIVFRICSAHIRGEMGRTDSINNFEFAYKFPPEQKKTILQKVIFSTGVLGSIRPVAIVEPVKISGNTIMNISLGSMDRFELLKLHIGDEVIIKYDIIPYLSIDESCKINTDGDIIQSPTTCIFCNQLLIKDPILKCINNECESRVTGKIINYLNKMSIMNISEGIVETLYNEGFLRSIEDLYRLKKHKKQLYELKGFGKKSIDKILDSIEYRKDVSDYELLGSIGITDIGRRMFKKILSIYYIDELKAISKNNAINDLICIEGVKQKTAIKIIEGVIANEKLISFLCSKLNVTTSKGGTKSECLTKVCFTKIRDKEFEAFLSTHDVEVIDGLNKDTSYLIIPDDQTSSSKISKAGKYNVPVITINQAYELFKYNK